MKTKDVYHFFEKPERYSLNVLSLMNNVRWDWEHCGGVKNETNVNLCIGYIERHNDFELVKFITDNRKQQVIDDFFDAENEEENFLKFVLKYIADEYAWMLTKEYRVLKCISIADDITFSIEF